ncbi:MAG: hypothetical protein QXG97_02735 [Nitrososphaerota archaeon]
MIRDEAAPLTSERVMRYQLSRAESCGYALAYVGVLVELSQAGCELLPSLVALGLYGER